MGRDTRRIAAPDNCLSPNTFREKKKIKSIINEGVRKDGRSENDLRRISLRVGMITSVTGSAYLECGRTKIICSVNGPRDVLQKNDSSVKGQLFCEFKYAPFSCKERQPYLPSNEEMAIAKSIQDTLEPVVLLHKFPNSRLDICILVLENDGGAVSAAITCVGAALSNAGVEMYDLPIGCTLVHSGTQSLVDPTAEEEVFIKTQEDSSKTVMAMMVEYKSQVIFIDSTGSVTPSVFSKNMKIMQSSCHHLLTNIRMCLKQHVEEMSVIDVESNEGSLAKKLAAEVKLLQPKKYIGAFLENNIRPDSRTLSEFRSVVINMGVIETANGSALVKMGETSVLCGIKAELTNPPTDEPDRGFFVPNVTLMSLCSNRYVPGPPTEQAQVYSQLVMDLWKGRPFVDPKRLCVAEGKLSWCLFAEMACLSYDGSVLDACVLALMAALKNTTLPLVQVDEESSQIKVTESTADLEMDNLVFSATFAVLEGRVVADPSAEEESLSETSVTVFLSGAEGSSVHSFGRIDEAQVLQCIACSERRFEEAKALLDSLN